MGWLRNSQRNCEYAIQGNNNNVTMNFYKDSIGDGGRSDHGQRSESNGASQPGYANVANPPHSDAPVTISHALGLLSMSFLGAVFLRLTPLFPTTVLTVEDAESSDSRRLKIVYDQTRADAEEAMVTTIYPIGTSRFVTMFDVIVSIDTHALFGYGGNHSQYRFHLIVCRDGSDSRTGRVSSSASFGDRERSGQGVRSESNGASHPSYVSVTNPPHSDVHVTVSHAGYVNVTNPPHSDVHVTVCGAERYEAMDIDTS